MADVSKVNVNSTDYNIKDSNAMHKGVDYVTAGKKSGTTLGYKATAEGNNTTASGLTCHAEGSNTTASDSNTHAEGSYTTASKTNAHAEGSQTTASAAQAHAEGLSTTASGDYSHSEGLSTTASGNASHAEGSLCEAAGSHAHAEGTWTKASSHDQHAEGKYNVEDTNGTYAHIIGGGTGDNARKNIFTVDWNGVARDGTQNRLLPFKAVSEAEYAALSQAEKTNGTAYFRYEANGIMREIQDNGSATSLTSGALPTGQTITSYINSNLVADTGWKSMQVNSQYGRGLVFYRKSFGIVTVNLQNQKFENYTPSTNFTVATLPSGFLPKGMTLYRLYGDQGYCYIDTDGKIYINASTASVWVGFNVAYHSA